MKDGKAKRATVVVEAFEDDELPPDSYDPLNKD